MSNYQTGRAEYREMSGWVGWIVFAAVIMMVHGTFHVNPGPLGAVPRRGILGHQRRRQPNVLTFNITSWGWIHLLLGILTSSSASSCSAARRSPA